MSREPLFNTILNGNTNGGNVGSESGGSGEPNATNGTVTDKPERASFISPGSLGNSSGSGNGSDSITGEPERKRRKYTKRAGKGGNQSAQSIPVEGLATILLQGHAMLAMITKTQEFMLNADESVMLAQAMANVSRHYDVQVAEKTLDWTQLIMVAGTVYGSRLAAMKLRKQMERANRETNAPKAPTAEEINLTAARVPEEYEPGLGAQFN